MRVSVQPHEISFRAPRILLRVTLVGCGAALLLGVVLETPLSLGRLAIGAFLAALTAAGAALVPEARYEFDAAQRVLRWSRSSLLRPNAGELPFAEIQDVRVRAHVYKAALGPDNKHDARPNQYSWVEFVTTAGERHELYARVTGREAQLLELANALRTLLGREATTSPVDVTVEDLVAEGELIAAIKLARRSRGLSLVDAKRLVEEIQRKTPR